MVRCKMCMYCTGYAIYMVACTNDVACRELDGDNYLPEVARINGGRWMINRHVEDCPYYQPGIEYGPEGGDHGGACDCEDQH